MSEILRANELTKTYGETPSVDGVSFSIFDAEIVGLLGANGAGKSTLMNMLTGCMPPSAGSVSVCGSDLATDPLQAKRRIGYLPEIPPLYVDMTVREQLQFVAQLRSVPARARAAEIDRACAATDILDVRGRLIRQLSKGYRQRVGMAQALIGSPRLLILDEPTAGLDPKQIMDFRALLSRLRERHTILISSHILTEVASVCTRLLVMRKGRLVADDTPARLGRAEHGASQIALTAGGNGEHIRAILAAVPGVAAVELRASAEQACWDATVTMTPGHDPRAALSMALAQASCPLLMMKPAGATLEEVVLGLVAQAESAR